MSQISEAVDGSHGSDAVGGPGAADDLLAGFSAVLAGVAERDAESGERSARLLSDTEQFLADFSSACEAEVRPAMTAVIDQLERGGGGGLIESHPGGEARFRNPCLILWMSLEGKLTGGGRPDLYPYLQLEADAAGRQVLVMEGDMWRGRGGNTSGPVEPWKLSDLRRERVIQELLDIARRAAQ